MAFVESYRGAGTDGANAAQRAVVGKFGGDLGRFQNQFNVAADDFDAQFRQLVGRSPNANEVSQYFGSVIGGSGLDAFGNNRGLELQQLTQNFIGSRYGDEANQYTETQLQGQQAEAQRLSDLFRTQGNEAINSTESSLLDYQNKLFERLRPNLITSLQSQGLLNSGGLNQAMAGAQTDLATAGTEEMRGLRLQNEQAANQIAFSGQAAPYEFKQQQLLNRPGLMQNSAQTGLQNAYGTFMNQLNYQNQLGLMNHQASLMPRQSGGFFKSVGSALAPSLGQALGQNFASAINPASYYGKAK